MAHPIVRIELTTYAVSDMPYGGDIPETGPIAHAMQFMGLGTPGGEPSATYTHVDPKFLNKMLGLAVAGYDLGDCTTLPVTIRRAPALAFGAHTRALIERGVLTEVDPESDSIDIYYCTYSGEPLFAHFYITGDGMEVFYTFRRVG